jgi:hypothetical protein
MDLSVPFTGAVSVFGGQGNYSSTSYTAVNGVILGSTSYHAALLINSTSSSPSNPKITGSSGGVATIAAAFSDFVPSGTTQALAITLDGVAASISQTNSTPPPSQTGLLFALNGAVDSMARIEWPSHTDAMALRKAATVIYEYETDASQEGYGAQIWFSTEGWTGDGPGWNVGFHSAYPCNLAYDANGQATGGTGSSGTTHAPEIAGLGSKDYIHTPTGSSGTAAASYKGTRRKAAVIIEDVGSNIRHTFYYNLPSTTEKIVIDFSESTLDSYSVPDALFRIGSSPWTDDTPFSGRNEETANGLIRFVKVFSAALSESDMLTEAATESNTPATSAGVANVYYTNINPTVSDISDKSGEGNDPGWANAQRPTLWEGYPLATDQTLAITLDGVAFSAAQNLRHSQSLSATLDGVTAAIAQSKTGNRTQSVAFTLDGVTAAVSQNLRHAQSLTATLDGIQVSVSQGITGSLSQSLAATLESVSASVAQNLAHAQELSVVLDGVSASIAQAISSPVKTQALAIELDGVAVDITQIGAEPETAGRGFVILNTESKLWWKRKPKAIPEEEATEKVERVVRVIERVARQQVEAPKPFKAQKTEVREAVASIVEQMPGFDWMAVYTAILDGLEKQSKEQQAQEVAAQEIARIQRMQADEDDVLALLMAVI